MEPEAAVSVYMLFIEEVFLQKKKKKIFFPGEKILLLEGLGKEALKMWTGSPVITAPLAFPGKICE